MSGHTKGPWSVDNDDAIKIKDRAGTLATVSHIHLRGRRPANEVEANANLISAAPTLFEFAQRRASAGDPDAIAIVEAINARS